jgi:tetratricopeptide (TPR) repeat protein
MFYPEKMMKNTSPNQTVHAWVEKLTLPTYPALDPDPNPMFFDSRDVQRAKGNIYPIPFSDQLSGEKVERVFEAVYLENEYIQVITLPELGGRIFAGQDKTNGYDFFYRHTVIKPALIGLFGPWISGGVEFNWPQHHRPSTFMPVSWSIERGADGSKTVWMGEHDPLNRTKGMVGVCLRPGKAVVETKVRLFNRTPFPQTFLWWANAGVHIDEQYQVIFPPDVHHTLFHTKEFVTSYPIARGHYGGKDYGEGTDISYWANSPATSFFAADSHYNFFGGYDHNRKAGVVHVADRHISPGKKFFTWGNGAFGHRWQRNLMDNTGEYLELMAGVYTDNQPDFSWIMPYETRTFRQTWYPIQAIGGMKNANTRAAINLEVADGEAQVGVYATEVIDGARVVLTSGQPLLDTVTRLSPGKPFIKTVTLPQDVEAGSLILRVLDSNSSEIISYITEPPGDGSLPEPYQPPLPPEKIESIEDLYLTGLHLEQYRHPVIAPEVYWQEALRRDPGESRCNVAMGKLFLRRGQFERAEVSFRAAVKRLTSRNPNPYDGEAHYNLGLALRWQGKLDEAYDALYRSTWNHAWQSAAFFALAQIDARRGDLYAALTHCERSLRTDIRNSATRNLKTALLRRLGDHQAATALAQETVTEDPLDYTAGWEQIQLATLLEHDRLVNEFSRLTRGDPQIYLDMAFDYAAAGLYSDAISLLEETAREPLYPMVAYALGYFYQQTGNAARSAEWYARGAKAPAGYCFPFRLDELVVLREVLRVNPDDGYASYYLGNLLYDKHQHREAVALWQEAVRLEPGLATAWRNLGLAAYNLKRDTEAAASYLEKAHQADPSEPRILFELDQLLKRKACPPDERLARLEACLSLVEKRDDLVLERAALYNRLGNPEQALELLSGRIFHAWEGGEGQVAGQYCQAQFLLARRYLETGDAAQALTHCEAGLAYPDNLGEVPSDVDLAPLWLYSGLALEQLGELEQARKAFEHVDQMGGWLSPARYYRAVALAHLNRADEAGEVLESMLKEVKADLARPAEQNYFYQALPSPVFDDDLNRLKETYLQGLAGLALLGLGESEEAKQAFARVLELDPSNLMSWEEFRRV